MNIQKPGRRFLGLTLLLVMTITPIMGSACNKQPAVTQPSPTDIASPVLTAILSPSPSPFPVTLLPLQDTLNLEPPDSEAFERLFDERQGQVSLPLDHYGCYLSELFYLDKKDTIQLVLEADCPLSWTVPYQSTEAGIQATLLHMEREGWIFKATGKTWTREVTGNQTSHLTVIYSPDKGVASYTGYFSLHLVNRDPYYHICRYRIERVSP
jgi:hypothetical protein